MRSIPTDRQAHYERSEWRNFMHLMRELEDANRTVYQTHCAIDEIEAIIMHTEQPILRERARRFLETVRRPKRIDRRAAVAVATL